ncbi:hypothetical protein LOAG_14203 [Loa loa]|uniref:Uncharacterized protein n=1 Tax=Loa loa TaxID=7209 RepID=A0A1S0TJ50_LOALO|nr:hypothetical protein LOAG_14203 [Loa loa]EFO14319.1 hypothetical protein LOAG_14203 [Loa loa]
MFGNVRIQYVPERRRDTVCSEILWEYEYACDPACLERNKYVIVRAHLKKHTVSVGLCKNETHRWAKSIVSPYICNRNIGKWEPDIQVNVT